MPELNLEQVLAELPDSADGIAAYLAEQNRSGKRCDGWHCPMANHLAALGFDSPFVQPDYVQVEKLDGWGTEMPPTPAALTEFIARFDEGREWPELVADA